MKYYAVRFLDGAKAVGARPRLRTTGGVVSVSEIIIIIIITVISRNRPCSVIIDNNYNNKIGKNYTIIYYYARVCSGRTVWPNPGPGRQLRASESVWILRKRRIVSIISRTDVTTTTTTTKQQYSLIIQAGTFRPKGSSRSRDGSALLTFSI